MSRFLSKNSRLMHFTALALILCMGVADVSLYLSYASGQKDAADELNLVTEEHPLEVALADGHYDGNGSDSENGGEGSVEIAEGKHLFNILEILPTEKKGVIGYTIAGCEPFEVDEIKEGNRVTVTKQQMKMAAMDALVNPNPGSSNGNDQNIVNNNTRAKYLKEMNEKLKESGESYPFTFEHSKTYSGYYKYVGGNKGFFCIDNKTSSNPTITSRFYSSGRSDYDYIFVYDGSSSDARDLNVTNHKRIKYINNDKFIKDWLGKTGNDIEKTKDETVFEVTTRTPVTVSIADIERADLILINDANKGDHYKFALELQNDLYGRPTDQDLGVHFYSPAKDGTVAPGNRVDFDDFEKVIKIYERVVVREDVAFVAEKTCCTEYNGGEIDKIDTNIRKLMFMLFYVKQGTELMAGRDLFSDFFPRYTDNPGATFGPDPEDPTKTITYYEMRKRHLADPTKYPVDYRAASLKRNKAKPTEPGYYYMHMHASYHVGHPLVIDRNSCITGAQTQNIEVSTSSGSTTVTLPVLDSKGNIVPMHDSSIIESRKLRIETKNPEMFTNAEFTRQDWPTTVDQRKYYVRGDISYYENCYESMSNTTDYIYINEYGKLVVSTKYSSDQRYNDDYWKYWYKIDADFYAVGGNTFRRRKWGPNDWDVWPWDSSQDGGLLTEWLMHRKTEGNIYDCNMHMWYDYWQQAESAGMQKYTTVKSPPFGKTYRNESLMEENGFFKGGWIKNALSGRTIKREETDTNHIVNRTKKNYYISMNILNGDGVNNTNPAARNKTLYYNQYEKDDIQTYESANNKSKIPAKIRIRSSCKLLGIKVYNSSGTVIASYDLNTDAANTPITVTGSTGRTLTLTPKNTMDETGHPELRTAEPDRTPIYSYEGSIYDLMSTYYLGNRNTKFKVEFSAEAPDGSTKTISDEITVVKRDFFMLD